MNNFLDNGTVLPSGLLNASMQASLGGFNKSYNNTALRVGVIVNIYSISDPKNRTKLTTEYDVVSVEQNEDKGATTILYRNCIGSDGLGGIADFFEKNLRVKEAQTYKGNAVQLAGQNGSIVLLLCLDGASDKAIVIGGFPHPDRTTNLTDTEPRLAGEYNGVAISVNSDGSTSLVFKGETNNDGDQVDSSQGNTEVKIEKDGSFQVDHSTVTLRLDKSGNVTLNATANANITINGDVNIISKGTATVEGTQVKLGIAAAQSAVLGDIFKKFFDQHIHPTAIGPSGPPSQPVPASALSTKVKVE